MERLIHKEADGDLTCLSRDFDKVIPTLFEYEETELTPDQIRGLLTQLEAAVTERDRLLLHIRDVEGCLACAHLGIKGIEPVCATCFYRNKWKWRGDVTPTDPGKEE